MRVNIMDRAQGRWKGILGALGIETKYLVDRHGPCPMCSGKDRWRWDNKEGRGTFYCSVCGAGNGIDLLKKFHGWDFKTAAKKIESVLGEAKREDVKPIMSEEECRAKTQALWRRAHRVTAGSPTALYLRNRMGGREVAIPSTIRSHPDRPGMIAIMQAPDGVASTAHVTLLTEAGQKAPTEKVRLFMPGSVAPGSAVRLGPEAEEMGVGEGLETCFAAALRFQMPVWSALNEGLLSRWEPPACVKQLHVFGDNDRNFVGQTAAYSLAKRLSLRPDRQGGPLRCKVHIPDGVGDDWNDVLVKKSVS
jgi:putative DNA primase/helicase